MTNCSLQDQCLCLTEIFQKVNNDITPDLNEKRLQNHFSTQFFFIMSPLESITNINRNEPIGDEIPRQTLDDLAEGVEAVYQHKWLLHRQDCQRGSTCDCDISHHCCKFELKVQVQLLDYRQYSGQLNTTEVWTNASFHVVNLWPNYDRASTYDWYRESSPGDPCDEHQAGFREDCEECQRLRTEGGPDSLPCLLHRWSIARDNCPGCRNIQRRGTALTMAHEIGHYIGFYDEYPESEGGRIYILMPVMAKMKVGG